VQEKIQGICQELQGRAESAQSTEDLEKLRIEYLGKKGRISQLLSQIAQVPPSERPAFGKWVNEAKDQASQLLEARQSTLRQGELQQRYAAESLDVTLPGRRIPRGQVHPLTQVLEHILETFQSLSFSIAEGPTVESDHYNFEALNIPPGHPARDMQDTFYVKGGKLLRTHTSPVQIHVMENEKPPLRVVSGGKVYRRDNDITHSPMFHQVEGFLVDRDISMADLKGILTLFVSRMFNAKTTLRFRPSFFPFTEPSAEMDISCILCGGKGCRVCSNSGWLEILGAGMIHPAVFRSVGYDPNRWSGFAFGLGVERIAMLKFRIGDIRLFFENDQRFLKQF
jgi:phenylalanyl-tRNA synthetase alpha chain